MDYEQLGREVGRLVSEKQAAYGDSFSRAGEVMRVLYPQGIAPEQLTDALCVVRIVDKLFRIATAKDAFGESPYCDIAGYGLLGVALADQQRRDGSGLKPGEITEIKGRLSGLCRGEERGR